MRQIQTNSAFHQHAKIFTEVFSSQRESHARARAIVELLSYHRPLPSLSIADFGCGAGDLAAALHKLGYKVFGIDRSEEMLLIAQTRHGIHENLTWVCADLLAEPQPIHVDAVLVLYSFIQTVPGNDGLNKCLNAVRTVLKPKGVAMFEFQNDQVARRKYAEGVKTTRSVAGYRVTSWSESVGVDYLRLSFDVAKEDKPEVEPIVFRHLLRRMTPEFLERLVKESGGTIVAWRDAPSFSDAFDPNLSDGVLAVVAFA